MKFSSIYWLLKRPVYWQQGLEILKRRLYYRNDEYGKHEAQKWCKLRAISDVEAFQKITEKSAESFRPVSEILSEDYNKALVQQDNCPVEMGGPGALDFLYHIIKHYKPSQLIETGVAYGWSSWSILQSIKGSEAHLISIDMPYINVDNDKFVGCCVADELKDQWTLLRNADRKGIPAAIRQFGSAIDFCHYDSDKSYSGRLWAYNILWESLIPGGLFISDDIQDNVAFKEFCELLYLNPVIIESQDKFVGFLQK